MGWLSPAISIQLRRLLTYGTLLLTIYLYIEIENSWHNTRTFRLIANTARTRVILSTCETSEVLTHGFCDTLDIYYIIYKWSSSIVLLQNDIRICKLDDQVHVVTREPNTPFTTANLVAALFFTFLISYPDFVPASLISGARDTFFHHADFFFFFNSRSLIVMPAPNVITRSNRR